MSKVKFKLNYEGVGQLLRSEEMKSVCEGYAARIQGRCGPDYEVTTHTGPKRVNASVHAATVEARRENAKNNTLLKAVRG